MRYTCSSCGKEHEDLPAIAFDAPSYYYDLSDEEKETIAEFTNDFCIIKDEDQTDRFIRAILFQPLRIMRYPRIWCLGLIK
jgi:hypothetical protein